MTDAERYLEICEAAALAGGRALNQWRGRVSAREKAPRDLVTEADLASQKEIKDTIHAAFPTHEFIGEESAADGEATHETDGYRWIVDPLDGTVNYVHGLLPYCVSVALARGNEVLVGVVYDPVLSECFSARKGGGAFLNGTRIRVSSCTRLADAMTASSLSANVRRDSEEISRLVEVVVSCRSLRRIGSSALNLCYLAAGRLDGYWSTSAHSWDVAAGTLMVREAGGIVTSVDGTSFVLDHPRLAAASTGELHAEFLKAIQRGTDRTPAGR